MIGKMIADHDCDRQSWDFQNMIVSDHKLQFSKMIVSDRRSWKKWSSLTMVHVCSHTCMYGCMHGCVDGGIHEHICFFTQTPFLIVHIIYLNIRHSKYYGPKLRAWMGAFFLKNLQLSHNKKGILWSDSIYHSTQSDGRGSPPKSD